MALTPRSNSPTASFMPWLSVGNPREFTQTEKEEQEIAEACNRMKKQHHLLKLPLPRQTGREGTGLQRQRKPDTVDQGPLAYIVGSHQHASRI